MNIVNLFANAARSHPDNAAIIFQNKTISYSGLQSQVFKTAAYFQHKGISKGDRVLVFVPMSPDLYRIVLAIFSLGATAVFVDDWAGLKRLSMCCRIAECKGFVGIPKAHLLRILSKEIRKIPVVLNRNKMLNDGMEIIETGDDDTALITFTTGTTGIPKAAKRTHGFLKAQFDALTDEIQPGHQDIDLTLLPIVLFVNLGVGATSLILKEKISKPDEVNYENIVSEIAKHRVNRITSSPYLLLKLSEHYIKTKQKTNSIKQIFTGGAAVYPEDAQLLIQAFPDSDINIVYGSTEAEPISSIKAKDLAVCDVAEEKGLRVGIPYHGTTVKIVSISQDVIEIHTEEDLKQLEVAPGETGEIIVSGNHVLKEYYKNPEALKRNKIFTKNETWHRTGDSGFVLNNSLFLTGRCKDLISYKDNFLSPFLIESQLRKIPGIRTGTLIEHSGKLLLIVETDQLKSEIIKRIPEIPYDEIILKKQIPRDPRHHSRIDMERLREEV
ncbi:MAG: AMP-binding protein [Bacteroidetes bacterium]|nr:AMP-binding protein [Bacteroidota bacterium]